jgi:hypothetical protein
MRPTRWIITLVFLISNSSAWAYSINENGDGMPLFWNEDNISFVLQITGNPGFDDIDETVTAAIGAWDAVAQSSLRLEYSGRTSGAELGYEGTDNVNLIAVIDEDWVFGPDSLAHTITTWSASTGEILDADIAINSNYDWGDGRHVGGYDLQSALTHEIGHTIGLGHASAHPEATMFARMGQGEVEKRDLDPDDVAGLLFLYGYGDFAWPDGPLESEGVEPFELVPSSCQVVSPSGGPPEPWHVLLLSGLLFLRSRRTPKSGRNPRGRP